MKTKTLQELHLEAIENSYHTIYRNMNEEEEVNNEEAASKSSEITEQIAIDFAEWFWRSSWVEGEKGKFFNPDLEGEPFMLTWQELFTEFLKTRV
jgi:hypothetical protein